MRHMLLLLGAALDDNDGGGAIAMARRRAAAAAAATDADRFMSSSGIPTCVVAFSGSQASIVDRVTGQIKSNQFNSAFHLAGSARSMSIMHGFICG